MRMLVIGGTRFVGRHLVQAALAHGHELTLFHRGTTNPGLFPEAESIHGDREADLGELAGRRWETVVDTCGYFPGQVRKSAAALHEAVERYVFISSISVYADFIKKGIDEDYRLATIEDARPEENSPETYGARKALCEQVVQDIYGPHALIVRPGLIVGPHDPTDRFTYWPVRAARGGELLAPDRPGAPLQIIDVRDLADFILKLVEDKTGGVFNATGPDYPLTFGKMLETCRQVSGSDAEFKWAPKEFLRENHVEPWSDLPAWDPDEGEGAGSAYIDISRAVKAGLRFRSLEETLRDTLGWVASLPRDREWKAGLTPEREAKLLELMKG